MYQLLMWAKSRNSICLLKNLCFHSLTSKKWRAYNQYLMRRRYGNEGQISSEIPFRYLCPFEVVHFPPPTSSINRPNPISHCIALVEILHTSWSYWCSEFIILLIPYISQHAYQIYHAIKTLQSSELCKTKPFSKQIISYSPSQLVVG